jgi:glycolate oxidase FAD binding subunit
LARPASIADASALLRELGVAGRAVRPVGGGTKPWGPAGDCEPFETGELNRIREHNVGDFTAILEAGVPFADAQAAFAEHGQAIAWDPPAPAGATLGGIMATADSGPIRHRYGGVRDLVVGVTVVLSDGTVAKAGSKVIKNVAGYDLAKLYAGSFGTLGLIVSISVRLHPLARETATAAGASDDPARLAAAVGALARLPLEADCLDVAWADGAGRVLVRYAGATAARRARETAARLDGLEAAEAIEDDGALWDAQRERQRSVDGAVLKVSGRPTDLPDVIRAAQAAGATVAARGVLGLSWLAFAPGDDLAERVATVRAALAPRACTVLDGAARVGGEVWPDAGSAQPLMERLKARFDPARIFRPGAFVGGI